MSRRSLRSSIFWLAAVQASGYLIPLLTIPFLIRTLGAGEYGRIAFAQAVSVYFILATDFGFNFSAARRAAQLRDDIGRLRELAGQVQVAKIIIATASVALVAVLGRIVPQFEALGLLLPLAMLEVVGAALYPVWLVQGLERMCEAALLTLALRFALLIAIIFVVRTPADSWIAVGLMCSGTWMSGICIWTWLIVRERILPSRPSVSSVIAQYKEGWPPFVASASNAINRSTNAVVLGLIAGPLAVAYFSLAEKLVRTAQELIRPITQATYPRLSSYASQANEEAMRLLRNLGMGVGLLTFVASASLFAFAPLLVRLIAGAGFETAAIAVRVMALIPLLSGLNNVLGTQAMLAFGLGRRHSRFTGASAFFSLVVIGPAAFLLEANGAALTYLLAEGFLAVLLIRYHLKEGPLGPVFWKASDERS